MVNFGMGILATMLQMIPLLSAYTASLMGQEQGSGLLHWIGLPFWPNVAASFLLLDLSGYVLHRASHQIPLLWRMHQMHHTDNFVDALTTFRSHPGSVAIFVAYQFAIIYALGIAPLGVLIYTVCKVLTGWLNHADVRPASRLSALCSTFLVTPAFHHRHHSPDQRSTDSNYGEVLTIWDRLLGSVSSVGGEVNRYGLGERHDRVAGNFFSQLLLPFQSSKRQASSTKPSILHSADR